MGDKRGKGGWRMIKDDWGGGGGVTDLKRQQVALSLSLLFYMACPKAQTATQSRFKHNYWMHKPSHTCSIQLACLCTHWHHDF